MRSGIKKSASADSAKDSKEKSFPRIVGESKFMLVPETVNLPQSRIVQLKHPKTGSPAIFHFSGDNQEICEVLTFREECRSWFLGDSVVGDGSLSFSATVNPVFLALPYFLASAQNRFVPLDQVLDDSEYPFVSKIAQNEKFQRSLLIICDNKKIGDQVLYRLNKDKLLSWLEEKFSKLQSALRKSGQLHSSILKEDENLRRHTWGIICDYLPPKIAEWLKEHLSIKEPVIVDKSPPLKRRKTEVLTEEPAENYCTPEAKAIISKPPVLTTAQKKLQQASVGSKSLTSFFKKSATK